MKIRTVVWMAILTAAVVLGAVAPGLAATDQQNLTINATVSAKAKLTLGVAAINFADADPDSVPSIAATENPVSVTVKAQTGGGSSITLTVQADGDLESGTDTIDVSNVTWTATGAGFVAGTMDTAAQTAGSWTGPGRYDGTFSYQLANSWDYAAGSYSQTVVYTLTAP
ncbi:MAG: hypothetical protein JXA57_01250 [Armatimonadetes bacterium]|nr:hypothetical protein [Armatimonadota bacterium]